MSLEQWSDFAKAAADATGIGRAPSEIVAAIYQLTHAVYQVALELQHSRPKEPAE